jgi:hypothetical protein
MLSDSNASEELSASILKMHFLKTEAAIVSVTWVTTYHTVGVIHQKINLQSWI